MICQDFQKDVDKGENDELRILFSEKEFLENEIHILEKKNDALKNSVLDFVEEILEDLHSSSSGKLSFLPQYSKILVENYHSCIIQILEVIYISKILFLLCLDQLLSFILIIYDIMFHFLSPCPIYLLSILILGYLVSIDCFIYSMENYCVYHPLFSCSSYWDLMML